MIPRSLFVIAVSTANHRLVGVSWNQGLELEVNKGKKRWKSLEKWILGIDPGSRASGYALLKVGVQSLQVMDSGVCSPGSKMDYLKRLSYLHQFFLKFVERWPPFELSLESLAYVKNVNSFGKLAQARGALLVALEPHALAVFEYPPNAVKSTVSGYGLSGKQNVAKSLGFALGRREFKTHDESDALALAFCHHFHTCGNQAQTGGDQGDGNPGVLKKNRKGKGNSMGSLGESRKHR